MGETALVSEKGAFLMCLLQKVEVIVKDRGMYTILEHDDVGVINDLVWGNSWVIKGSHNLLKVAPESGALWVCRERGRKSDRRRREQRQRKSGHEGGVG